MPRVTIQQFRAALAGRADPRPLVRAYRELARRPGLAGAMLAQGWPVWEQQDPPPASA